MFKKRTFGKKENVCDAGLCNGIKHLQPIGTYMWTCKDRMFTYRPLVFYMKINGYFIKHDSILGAFE